MMTVFVGFMLISPLSVSPCRFEVADGISVAQARRLPARSSLSTDLLFPASHTMASNTSSSGPLRYLGLATAALAGFTLLRTLSSEWATSPGKRTGCGKETLEKGIHDSIDASSSLVLVDSIDLALQPLKILAARSPLLQALPAAVSSSPLAPIRRRTHMRLNRVSMNTCSCTMVPLRS